MTRKRYSMDSEFEKLLHYSRVVDDGDWVFVSGCSGFDYSDMSIADDMATQARQVFNNIDACLEWARLGKESVVRIRVMIADREHYQTAAQVIGDWCEPMKPANTTWFADLPDPRIKIEIEVTARRKPGVQGNVV